MLSKLMIDLDHDNQPIIKIDYRASDDVRDKMVKRFLETFGGGSAWAQFHFDHWQPDQENPNRYAIIRPIPVNRLTEEGKSMASQGKIHDESLSVSTS